MAKPSFDKLVDSGIVFLNELTRYYGTAQGNEIWNQMYSVLGAEVAGRIMFKMLDSAVNQIEADVPTGDELYVNLY